MGGSKSLKSSWYSKLWLVERSSFWLLISKAMWASNMQFFLLHCTNGSSSTMYTCLTNLELHFSNLTSFIMVLFDTKIMGVCTINTSRPKMDSEIVFLFLRYWGLNYNWGLPNVSVFDGGHGVRTYLQKLKEILM